MILRKRAKAVPMRRRASLVPLPAAAAATALAAMMALWGSQGSAQETPPITCEFTSAGIALFSGEAVVNLPDAVPWQVSPNDLRHVKIDAPQWRVFLRGTVEDVKRAIANCAFVDLAPNGDH